MIRKKLGDLLVESGAIDPMQLQAALGRQKQWGGRLGRTLLDMGFVSEEQIVDSIAKQLGLQVVQLSGMSIDPDALAAVPQEVCEKHVLLPYARVKPEKGLETVYVAMSDPTNLTVVDDLRFRTGRHLEVAVATESEIERAIRRSFYGETIEYQEAGPTDISDVMFAGHVVEFVAQGSDVTPVVVEPPVGELPHELGDEFEVDEGAETFVVGSPVESEGLLELTDADMVADGPFPPVGYSASATPAHGLPFPPVKTPVSGISLGRTPAAGMPFASGDNGLPFPSVGTPAQPLALRERLLLETIEALAAGKEGDEPLPARHFVAALARVLIRKGLLTEQELIDELARK